MTNLAKLNVSLTKHGAHKIAVLLKKFDKDDLLANLRGKESGVNIDTTQARKNLSVGPDGVVPVVWGAARGLGPEYIDALVFVAIIFSHKDLIDAMRSSKTGRYIGTINRGIGLNGKAYTNFAHTIEELGFCTKHSVDKVSYDLSKLFSLAGLGPLVRSVLELKLQRAGWSGTNSLEEECTDLNLHEVLGIEPQELILWLQEGTSPGAIEDLGFFSGEESTGGSASFEFVPGHNAKKTGAVDVGGGGPKTANLLHNDIQNKLFEKLCQQFGGDNVGSEISTGDGTSIDLVVKHTEQFTFYEIKTAHTVKACIRQAIPQLLEYAYWRGESDHVKRLVIVSPHPVTSEAEAYLKFLRESFTIPLEYEQFQP